MVNARKPIEPIGNPIGRAGAIRCIALLLCLALAEKSRAAETDAPISPTVVRLPAGASMTTPGVWMTEAQAVLVENDRASRLSAPLAVLLVVVTAVALGAAGFALGRETAPR